MTNSSLRVNEKVIARHAPISPMETPARRLRRARVEAGYETATDAARAMGVKPPTYLGHENGTTALRRDAAIRYANFFRVSLDWLLTGVGEGRKRRLVPVMGFVGAGAEIVPFDSQGALDFVDPPPAAQDAMAAVVRGDSMHPFRDGWLVFWRYTGGITDDMIGHLCVVQVKDGPLLLKVLRRGAAKDLWNLESWNAPLREGVALIWASRVIDIRPH